MLQFSPLTLSEIPLVRPYVNNFRPRETGGLPCDATIGGIFMWRDFFGTEYAVSDETLFFRVRFFGAVAYPTPLGGKLLSALNTLYDHCADAGEELTLCTVTARDLPLIQKSFDCAAFAERDWFDYLYNAEDLAALAGRRYSGQRNHINYFKREYPAYEFIEISRENISEILSFYNYFITLEQKDSAVFMEDRRKVYELLERFRDYGLLGGAIRANGRIVAFALGEIVGDTLFIHVEKADFTIRGTYQMIVNEFARHYAVSGVRFINREDDAGDLGLRTSKLSYHPIELIEKYTIAISGRK